MKKKSSNINILQSVMLVIVLLALYDIFRYIISPLSLRNQRGDYEPGEVYYNFNEAEGKMLLAKKENVYHISTSSSLSNVPSISSTIGAIATSNTSRIGSSIGAATTSASNTSNISSIGSSIGAATTSASNTSNISPIGSSIGAPTTSASNTSNTSPIGLSIFKTLNKYLPEISKQSFRGIKLNSILLCEDMVDNDIDLVDWDEMDEKLAAEFTKDAIESDEGKDPSHFDLDLQRLQEIDNKYINSTKDLNDEKTEIVCCDGNFCGDAVRIKEHREVILCRNDWCHRGNHVLCLYKDSRITDYEYSMRLLLDCVDKKAQFVCPDCILYQQHLTKSLKAVGTIIDSLSQNIFECRINMDTLRESKYFYFNSCLNIIELIRNIFCYYYSFEEEKIKHHGNEELAEIHKRFKKACPVLFNIDVRLILSHYFIWKEFILYHVIDGRLRNLWYIDNYTLFRDKCLDFRSFACNDKNIKNKTESFWKLYDCAKSMGCTETLVENVGSTEKNVLGDKKFNMRDKKMMKKVVLQQHYKGDTKKGNQFISAAEPIYRDNIGSVCVKDKKNATSIRKVIKRINKQTTSGPFSLPILFNTKKHNK